VTASPGAALHRDLIISLAARHRLPAVYFARYNLVSGGLLSYGPNFPDQFRRAASYIDRILKGEKPADLPVQAPTKYELVINLKTAKALGLEMPTTVLARADDGLREMSNSSPQSGAKRTGRGYRGGDHNVERHQPSGPSPPRH